MDGLAQGVYNGAIRLGECLPGVVGKESFLPGLDNTGLLEPGEVAAQVGLVEFQDCFKVTSTKSPLMKQIQDAKPIWIGQGFQDSRYVHDHRVMQKQRIVYAPGDTCRVWPWRASRPVTMPSVQAHNTTRRRHS
jgi:hypothetical protein